MGVVARTVRRFLPPRWQPPARYFYERTRGLLERELPRAVAAVRPGDRVVDVGANVGIYTYAFARAGARVEAFEPQSACAATLRAFAAATRSVHVHEVALGAGTGNATLRVPMSGGRALPGNASLRPTGRDEHTEPVTVASLDSFAFPDVALVKVDVEGMEMQVILGAVETLRRCRPLLLVEIEQRHHDEPIGRVFSQITALGYAGHYLDAGGRLRSIDELDLTRDQGTPPGSAGGIYVNNFLFQPVAPGSRRWTP